MVREKLFSQLKERVATWLLAEMVTGIQVMHGLLCAMSSPLPLPDPHSPWSQLVSNKWRRNTPSLDLRENQGAVNGRREERMNGKFTEDKLEMGGNPMKRCLASLVL